MYTGVASVLPKVHLCPILCTIHALLQFDMPTHPHAQLPSHRLEAVQVVMVKSKSSISSCISAYTHVHTGTPTYTVIAFVLAGDVQLCTFFAKKIHS
jgi:hypothetical protein